MGRGMTSACMVCLAYTTSTKQVATYVRAFVHVVIGRIPLPPSLVAKQVATGGYLHKSLKGYRK